ncbi:hypothetical protein ABZ826_36890 [Streptomyces sp. NPDC047515]|uniref:hypothetical protein n=1 Tax=Streptomyces sp. NPDC047515 TaxID=3155380 RepID=UPI0033EC0064
MTDWEDFDWVVWRINVDDPEQRVTEPYGDAGMAPDLAEHTRGPMTELAASLGCVYEDCCDDDSYGDDVHYYAWWVRLPQAEHARRGKDGIPVAVDRLRQYLVTVLPDQLPWEIVPDRERTVDHAASSAMRDAYTDLIVPFEQALMPLRVDGADELEPRARSGSGKNTCWSARSTCGCATTRTPRMYGWWSASGCGPSRSSSRKNARPTWATSASPRTTRCSSFPGRQHR